MTVRLASGRTRRLALVLAAVIAVGALTALILRATSPGPTVVASLPGAEGAPVHTMTLEAAPKPTPPALRSPHDDVVPAAPTSFRIAGPAFTIDARVCGMANVRPLDPPGDQYHTVCWVREGFGVAPGVGSGGTSYILGHSWARAPLVLTPLSTTAMAHMDMSTPVPLAGVPTFPTTVLNGYRITLGTPNGTLVYTVDSAYAVSKQRAADVAPLMDEKVPNRLVIITCGVNDGVDVDVDIIVDATLTSSQKA